VSIVALGLWLRLGDIGVRTLSHPENSSPGLDVPSWVRFPPPRHDVVGVLRGAFSIALVAWIALREGPRWTALIAAGLLATHGHHVYWSQLARMYTPAACLALLLDIRDRRAPSVLRIQVAAVIASLWVVQLSIYQNPPSRWQGSSSEYFQLGYLFLSGAPFFGERPSVAFDGPWLLALGVLLLLVAGFARRPLPAISPRVGGSPSRNLPLWFELAVVAGSTALLIAFAKLAPPRLRIDWTPIWALCAAPALLAAMYLAFGTLVEKCTTAPPRWLARVASLDLPLSWQLAVVPALCMVAVSVARGVFVPRGTILFQPFFCLAVAHALVAMFRVRVLGAAMLALVFGPHGASVAYFRAAESTPRDYAGLASKLLSELRPTDLILVRNNTVRRGEWRLRTRAPNSTRHSEAADSRVLSGSESHGSSQRRDRPIGAPARRTSLVERERQVGRARVDDEGARELVLREPRREHVFAVLQEGFEVDPRPQLEVGHELRPSVGVLDRDPRARAGCFEMGGEPQLARDLAALPEAQFSPSHNACDRANFVEIQDETLGLEAQRVGALGDSEGR
jgi:hypothetical protein